MMHTDKGDDGDMEKSDVVVAINYVIRLWKVNFETPRWEMAQCSITKLKKTVSESGGEATSIPTLKQKIKE